MKARRSSAPRGQTILLFALGLMLMALMVVMTLSFAMKTREKIELQTLADTAAYSEAVATARTYNVMAVLMRTEFALLVSSTGTQSLIDWSTEYLAAMNVTLSDLADIKTKMGNDANCAGDGATVDSIVSNIQAEQARIAGVYDTLDIPAGADTAAINSAEAAMQSVTAGQDFFDDYKVLTDLLTNQALADTIVKKATPLSSSRNPREVTAPPAFAAVSLRETDKSGASGAACDEMQASCTNTVMHQIEAVMGSRGYAFVTSRAGGDGPILNKLNTFGGGNMTVNLGLVGSGYFGALHSDWNHSNTTDGSSRYADDHTSGMSVTVTVGLCSKTSSAGGEATSRLMSNLQTQTDDTHDWTGGGDSAPNPRHNLIGPIGQGNWPIVIDFNVNIASDPQDVFAQPKLYAVVQRDYQVRYQAGKMDPWNFFFDFRFTRSGSFVRFDSRGLTANGAANNLQVALASGIAYYHRPGYWQEPPNFMNPFWRATLVSATIDRQGDIAAGGQDIPNSLPAGPAQQTVNALKNAGFQGWQ